MKLETERHVCLMVALLMSLMSGTMYAFGAFETELKSHMNWSQTDIQLMGVAMHVGTYLMKPFCGAILDSCGPKVAACVAACLSLVGYGVVSACVAHTTMGSVPLMAAMFFLVSLILIHVVRKHIILTD